MPTIPGSRTGVADADVLRIVQRSWQFNHLNRVFGVLELRNGRFSQVIEARQSVMNSLVPAILADVRHQEVDISAMEPIEARTFTNWSVSGFGAMDTGEQPAEAKPAGQGNVIFSDRFRRGSGGPPVRRGDPARRNNPTKEN